MAETYGERPRPWVLALGFADSGPAELWPEHRNALDSLTDVTIDYVGDPRTVAQEEYDVAVSVNGAGTATLSSHLDVFQFGGPPPDAFKWEAQSYYWSTRSVGRARRLKVPETTPLDIAKLASATLVPWVESQSKPYSVFVPVASSSSGRGPIIEGPVLLDAFLQEAREGGRAIAGRYARRDSDSQCWWLPIDIQRVADWLSLAFDYFARAHPQRFPNRPGDWMKLQEWMTASELALTQELSDLESEMSATIQAFRDLKSEATAKLESARGAADAGPRRLLTAQGSDLVDEVVTTLAEFGFSVRQPDEERASSKETLLEDIEALDEDWNSLIEVRGYARGAKSADLQRIERFVTHFVKRTTREPSAKWYIVNHNLTTAPDARPRVLGGADEDVSFFAEGNGLVVDTRELFRLRRAVAEGAVAKETARMMLKTTRGIFRFNVES